jgi:SET domain
MNRPLNPIFIKSDATGDALYAARTFRPGEIVLDFAEVEWRAKRDRHTVQHPGGWHLYHPVLATVSHNCDPNCQIDVLGRVLVALKTIAPGEAISFDYEITETRFAHPFECLCGYSGCRGRIG